MRTKIFIPLFLLLGLIASNSYAQSWPGGWTNRINFNILKVDTLEERTSGQGIYVTHSIEFAATVTFSSTVTSGVLTILLEDATTNSVTDLLILNHTGGAVAAGFGSGIAFQLEDAGGSEEQASIDVVMRTVTDGSEDADIVSYVNSSGDMTEALRIIGFQGETFVVVGGSEAGQALQALTVESLGSNTTTIGVSQDTSQNLLVRLGSHAGNAGFLELRTHNNVTDISLKSGSNDSYLNMGNLGLNTAAPLKLLDAAGSVRIKGTGTVALTGTIDPTASATVDGVGTLFLTELVIGDQLVVTGENRTVTAIASNIECTVDAAFSDNANDTTPDKIESHLVITDSGGTTDLVVDADGAIMKPAGDMQFDVASGTMFKFGENGTDGIQIDASLARIHSSNTGDIFDLDSGLWQTNTFDIRIDPDAGSVGVLYLGDTGDNDTTRVVGYMDAQALVSDTYNFGADSQGDDDYEVAIPGIIALTTGLMVTFTANTLNTDGATLEITSVGDLDAILKMRDQALVTGDIEAGQVIVVVFDGTNWQMTSQLAQ